jgi:hypothetical protein
MIADAVRPRTLLEPTPAKIRAMIQIRSWTTACATGN